MAVPKHILSLYQDGVELKTVLASVYKGKIKIEAVDQATLVTPFKQHLETDDEDSLDIGGLESTEDAFGIDSSPPSTVQEDQDQSQENPEAFGDVDADSAEGQFEEEETNEDILLSLMTRVPAKRYAHAINLPRSLVNTLHLRGDYTQMKPKHRDKQIFNEVVERLDEASIPKDHYDCLLTQKGEAYAFAYKGDIPIIQAFDDIQSHLKVKPRFVSVCSDEVALVNLLRYNYKVEDEETIALINIEDVQSSFIITQGQEVLHFSQSIREGLNSPSLLNSISGRLLYDQDLGHYQDIDRIILAGEARQIAAKEYFEENNEGVNVEYFTIDPERFIIPQESKESFTDYAIPLGLAVQVLFPKKKETLQINLLPDYVYRRQKAFKLAWHGLLLLIMIFLVPLAVNWMHEEKEADRKEALQKISSLEKSIHDIEWVTYMVDSLSMAHAVAEENLASLTKLSEGSLRWSVTLQQLLLALEEVNGLWIADLKSTKGGIELTGLSLYRNRIPRFIEYFEDAEISSVTPDDVRGKTVYRFNLSVNAVTENDSVFNPQVIEPPPRPVLNLDSSSPIPIIEEEPVVAALDTIPEIPIVAIKDSTEAIDSVMADTELVRAQDSLLSVEAFEALMPMTSDIARLADSLDQLETDSATTSKHDFVVLNPTEVISEEAGSGLGEIALKIHRVKSGESLKSIARKKLGNADRWPEIYNLNRDMLSNPNHVEIGQVLIVLQDESDLESITHTVRQGESLKLIAERYYGDSERWQKLVKLNESSISNPNQIFPGQKLIIITIQQRYLIQTHTISSGETLKIIAGMYLGDEDRWEEVFEMNKKNIKSPNMIFPGQRIKIRNETGVKASKSSKR